MTREENDALMARMADTMEGCDPEDAATYARALGELAKIETAHVEKETKQLELEKQEKLSAKDRIVNIFKIVGTIFVAIITGGVTIWNARSVMKFEETGSIRTKAWTGVKPDKTQEIR